MGIARALRSVIALSAARIGAAAVQFAILPIVARYLTPEEFGVVALALVFVMIAMVLSDAGMGRSLLRDKTIDDLVWSSAFWLFTALGLVLAAFILGIAPLAAYIYASPDLLPMVSALAVVPLLQSLSAVFFAELEKRQAFLSLALVVLVSAALSSVVAVWMVVLGAGAWALIVQQITLFALQFVMLVALSRFRPKPQFSLSVLGDHLRFGIDTLGWSLLQLVYRQSLPFVVGKVGSMDLLGAFAMALRFTRLPALVVGQPVGRVVYVRMAMEHSRPGAVDRLFVFGTRVLAGIVIPPVFLLAASGEAFFPVLLSDRWVAVAPIFALLAPGIALQTALSLNGSAFMACGRTDLRLRSMMEMTVIWLVAMAIAAPFGVMAIAAARTLSMLVYIPRMAAFTHKAFGADLYAMLGSLARPVLISTAAVAAHVFLTDRLDLAPVPELVLASMLLMCTWGLLFLLDYRRLRSGMSSLQGIGATVPGE